MNRAHLNDLLHALEPRDSTEAQHKARILELVASATAPFTRDHYVPGHVTASAFIVNPARDALLLIFHGKLLRWLQPGGHVDADDANVVGAARREVSEEVGLDDLPLAHAGLFDVDIHLIPARGEQPAHEHFDVRFLFEAPEKEVKAGSDARAARWVTLRDLTQAAEGMNSDLPTDESVLRAVRKLQHGQR
jgi:8-oxo-dGTP pyrophosphatase MutT (NUDIX family)